MKTENKSPNYAATVVEIKNTAQLSGLDNLVGVSFFGFQALVSKGVEVGTRGLLFTAECQLSEAFLKNNNLYRHPEKNADTEQKGYFDDNGRVRAVKFRGNSSSAFFIPLDSLDYLGVRQYDLKTGTELTHIDGQEICRKYYIHKRNAGPKGSKQKMKNGISAKMFPEHVKTANFWREMDQERLDFADVDISIKLHGTSCRLSHSLVEKKLSWFQKALQWVGVPIQDKEWVPICGSRRVNMNPSQHVPRDEDTYYKKNVYIQTLERFGHSIPKNWVIYGEIIGWAGESQVQKNFTYGQPKGTHDFFCYRISIINEDGVFVDLAPVQIREFCESIGMKTVNWLTLQMDVNIARKSVDERWMNKRYWESYNVDLFGNKILTVDDEAPCDEGVVLCVNGLHNRYVKAKSPDFLAHETKQLDKGVVDMESAADVQEEEVCVEDAV